MTRDGTAWITLAGAIVTSVFGQALLKAGAGRPTLASQLLDWRSLLGLCLYGGTALLYMLALRRLPVSVALPCTAASYVAVALVGHFAFAEPLGGMQLAALSLIVGGVVLMAAS